MASKGALRRPEIPLTFKTRSVRSARTAAVASAFFAAVSAAGGENLIDDPMNRLAVSLATGLSENLENFQPESGQCAPSLASVNRNEPPVPAGSSDGEIALYSCTIEVDEDALRSSAPDAAPVASASPRVAITPTPNTRSNVYRPFAHVPGRKTAGMYADNDNLFFDLIRSGDDNGYTFAGGLNYEQVLGRRSMLGRRGDVVGVELSTSLYTVYRSPDHGAWNDMAKRTRDSNASGVPLELPDENGVLRPVFVKALHYDPDVPERTARQQFLNVNRLKVYKEWDRKEFFVRGALAFESRQNSGNPVAVRIQDKFHAAIDAYRWKSYSPDGKPGTTQETKVGVQELANGEKVDVVELVMTPDVAPEPTLNRFGDWAVTSGIGAGKRIDMFQGRCQLEASVSADLVLQGGKSIRKAKLDPNTRIAVESGVKASLLRNAKWNDSLVNLKASGAMMYFPVAFDETSRSWLPRGSAELEVLPHVGKRGNQLGVAFQMFSPGGQGNFQKIDDRDPVLRMAVRFLFGGKSRR